MKTKNILKFLALTLALSFGINCSLVSRPTQSSDGQAKNTVNTVEDNSNTAANATADETAAASSELQNACKRSAKA